MAGAGSHRGHADKKDLRHPVQNLQRKMVGSNRSGEGALQTVKVPQRAKNQGKGRKIVSTKQKREGEKKELSPVGMERGEKSGLQTDNKLEWRPKFTIRSEGPEQGVGGTEIGAEESPRHRQIPAEEGEKANKRGEKKSSELEKGSNKTKKKSKGVGENREWNHGIKTGGDRGDARRRRSEAQLRGEVKR